MRRFGILGITPGNLECPSELAASEIEDVRPAFDLENAPSKALYFELCCSIGAYEAEAST